MPHHALIPRRVDPALPGPYHAKIDRGARQETAMKAEERKALEQNSLVEGLEKAYEGVRKGPSKTTLYWLCGIGAVALVIWLFVWFRNSAETQASQRWLELDSVAFPGQLDELLQKGELKDTPQGRLARFKEARMTLADGLRTLGDDRKKALQKIRAATEEYEKLLKSSGRVPVLQQEALWGAAKGRESLGEIEDAKKHYNKLVAEFESSYLGKDAAEQLKRLNDPANAAALSKIKSELGTTN
jgi:hypothetical protein